MTRETELLIRKATLKDVEIWLNRQYLEIENELRTFTEDRGDDSAKTEEDEDEAMGMSFQDWRIENDHE